MLSVRLWRTRSQVPRMAGTLGSDPEHLTPRLILWLTPTRLRRGALTRTARWISRGSPRRLHSPQIADRPQSVAPPPTSTHDRCGLPAGQAAAGLRAPGLRPVGPAEKVSDPRICAQSEPTSHAVGAISAQCRNSRASSMDKTGATRAQKPPRAIRSDGWWRCLAPPTPRLPRRLPIELRRSRVGHPALPLGTEGGQAKKCDHEKPHTAQPPQICGLSLHQARCCATANWRGTAQLVAVVRTLPFSWPARLRRSTTWRVTARPGAPRRSWLRPLSAAALSGSCSSPPTRPCGLPA